MFYVNVSISLFQGLFWYFWSALVQWSFVSLGKYVSGSKWARPWWGRGSRRGRLEMWKRIEFKMGQKYEGNYKRIMLLNRIVCIFPQKYKFSTIANMSNSNSKLFFTKELLINSTIHTSSSAVAISRHWLLLMNHVWRHLCLLNKLC